MIGIDRALLDRNLLGAALGDPASWRQWISVARAAFALPMSEKDHAAFAQVSGGREPPKQRVAEWWTVAGRRSGKTRIAAATAVFIAAIEQHRLAPGEVGHVLIIAASKAQAATAFSYVLGYLESSPILRQQIENVTAEEVRLRGGIVISVHSGSYRTVRGRTLIAVIADETSFWKDDTSAEPDVELYRACVPALAARKGMWVGISTGYRKRGLLFQKWRDHFGRNDDDVLVIQAASGTLNPTLDPAMIERAKSADPEAAEAEWGGGFRSDIGSFLSEEVIEAAIDLGRPAELPPRKGIEYRAFVDPSGGRHDAFALAIGHVEDDRHILDVIRHRSPPFDPQSVVEEYAALLKDYRISEITGDNYAAAWVETAWSDAGLAYERSSLPKSGLYLEALPIFMRGAVSIPDHPLLVRELRLLERRTSRVGKDIVDHGRNGSDDLCNSLCGLLYILTNKSDSYVGDLSWLYDKDEEPEPSQRRNPWGAVMPYFR